MKNLRISVIILSFLLILCSCTEKTIESAPDGTTIIALSDEGVKVNGKDAETGSSAAVYVANDIIYYEEGKDFTYGEGNEKDAHSKEDADSHTVVHITKAGKYSVSGKLSRGQIGIDLGKEAKENRDAVVTLILNGVDITCEVAPAVIFYNVFECGDTNTDKAGKDVDTSAAGANVIIADDTENTVNGSYVARIYKPETVVLNEDKTVVEDAKKLHKYDGAFYSRMSMNIDGGEKGTGTLTVNAENEGIGSELHLTVNGGNININSGNDGINTNEDGVSVTAINGGVLKIRVTGETGEGDGIDSNGWLVINGGKVEAAACSFSADAGIDSDMGIHINGGSVIATGSMLDPIADGSQTYAVFSFGGKKNENTGDVILKDSEGKAIAQYQAENAFSVLLLSSPELTPGTYTLLCGEKQLECQSGGMAGRMNPDMAPESMPSEEMSRPDFPESAEFSEGTVPPEIPSRPEGGNPVMPDGEMPSGTMEPPEKNNRPESSGEWTDGGLPADGASDEFEIKNGANMFMVR